ncbi:MAG: toll/interleukin-1 receptor domain-containing protein [Thermodesulfobacteriales bacterium]|nr:MAG: toll/interleukin-1 receptor domain-containing protein [Thermodesulfobacteriales bacterium]
MEGLKVFYSYCHVDELFRVKLEKWLSTLRHEGLISEWYDGKITAGQQFNHEIQENLDKADLVLLLLSQDFIASTACIEEMQFAISRKDKRRTIPIILKPCAWKDTECEPLLALPKDAKPITSWSSEEDAWLEISTGIRKVVQEYLRTFTIRESYLEEIQAVEFVRQSKKKVTLDDIFVFPIVSIDKNTDMRETISSNFFESSENKAIIVLGEEVSGKTTLARILWRKMQTEYSTILLDGTAIFKSKNFDEIVQKAFSAQLYGNFREWMELPNRAVIVDDFHHKISRNAIEYFTGKFDKTILMMDIDEYLVYFKDDSLLAAFTPTTIRALSLSRQEELVRKWLSLSDLDATHLEVDEIVIDNAEEKLNTVIASNQIVPRYPFYVLSILQTFEAFMPKDFSITAYGHCYNALVTAQLMRKGIGADGIDSCFNFLTELSKSIRAVLKRADHFGTKEYEEFKSAYSGNFFIQQSIVSRLEAKDYPIIQVQPDHVRFDHQYIYYYFLGKDLASHGTDAEIDHLCENIHLKENAFILIFAIHHTESRRLIDSILRHSLLSFDNIQPATLEPSETNFMQELMFDLPEKIISLRSVEENRKEERDNSDHEEDTDEPSEENYELLQVTRGLKIIEVLGQILKNRAGSFDRNAVLQILQNTINLGLRILNLFLGDLRKPEFTDWLRSRLEEAENDSIRRDNKKFDDAKRLRFIEKTIQLFGHIVTIGMIAKITHSISSEKLIEPISLLCEQIRTSAYELICFRVRLFKKGVEVQPLKNLVETFKTQKNYWAERLLSFYVQSYINTHKVDHRKKQQALEILGLNKPSIDLSHISNR